MPFAADCTVKAGCPDLTHSCPVAGSTLGSATAKLAHTAFLRSHTMLELRPNCERCDVDLPPSSLAARICSFECTFCADCAEHLTHLCPNCGGELVRRPVRPAEKLQKYPAKMRS